VIVTWCSIYYLYLLKIEEVAMRKVVLVLLAVLFCIAMPVMAQDDQGHEGHDDMAMTPPPSLETDDFCKWMVGQWQGWSEGAMGKMRNGKQLIWP